MFAFSIDGLSAAHAVPVQPVAPAPRKLKKRGQRATVSSQHNGNAKARSSRAKRTATEAGIPDVAPCNGTNSGAKQQRANVPETQGQAADQVMADAADASKADDDDFEPLPPPKVRKASGPGLPHLELPP